MLEIFFLRWFVRKLAAIAKAKGRSGGWGGLGAAMWIGGEISGFVIGGILDAGPGGYGIALLLAVLGAVVAYVIVNALASRAPADVDLRAVTLPPIPYGPAPDLSNPYAPPRQY